MEMGRRKGAHFSLTLRVSGPVTKVVTGAAALLVLAALLVWYLLA